MATPDPDNSDADEIKDIGNILRKSILKISEHEETLYY